ncbi:hypothetical protein MUK42_37792 [Musa troglodytarum]|uniref:Uncharacterized protein n=1 Tax=Musa troglodytarum TaxID=320322 RepID=A0A9E7EEQ9_9LILI|nr:hypothetical protein MUK42_37792 [Musa troglodytarum]
MKVWATPNVDYIYSGCGSWVTSIYYVNLLRHCECKTSKESVESTMSRDHAMKMNLRKFEGYMEKVKRKYWFLKEIV